jgi:outer membrane receptor for ferrienterochelin and colicin
VKLSQPEFWSKTSFRFNDVQQITAFASGFVQQQNAWFGTVNYQAAQVNGYLNLQHEFNHSNGSLKSGMSLRYLKLNETIAFSNNDLARTFSGDYRREEIIPGLFAEHTWRLLNNRLSWITGLRADFHNQFGTFITPRTLLKYDLTPTTIVRANIGTGWRTVNLFSENIGLLVSSRNLLFAEALEPEQAVNAGINLTQKYSFFDKLLGGYLSIDYYRTEFSNQVFPDYDSDPTKAIITNFRGQSISESFQVEGVVRWQDLVEWKVGYSWVEVYRMVSENRQELPFNPRHKVMSAISIQPKSKRFQFDINAHWYGSQRLPDTRLNPEVYQCPSTSPTYRIINTQITYRFQQWEVYTGCENLFDFRQLQPILGWQDPFGRYFDTSFVWGPTRGREFYLGIRYRVK